MCWLDGRPGMLHQLKACSLQEQAAVADRPKRGASDTPLGLPRPHLLSDPPPLAGFCRETDSPGQGSPCPRLAGHTHCLWFFLPFWAQMNPKAKDLGAGSYSSSQSARGTKPRDRHTPRAAGDAGRRQSAGSWVAVLLPSPMGLRRHGFPCSLPGGEWLLCVCTAAVEHGQPHMGQSALPIPASALPPFCSQYSCPGSPTRGGMNTYLPWVLFSGEHGWSHLLKRFLFQPSYLKLQPTSPPSPLIFLFFPIALTISQYLIIYLFANI